MNSGSIDVFATSIVPAACPRETKRRMTGRATGRYLLFALLCLHTTHVRRWSADGSSSSPLPAAFAPSPRRLPKGTDLPPPASSGAANSRRAYGRRGASSIASSRVAGAARSSASGVRFPSNPYTQFYKQGVLVGIESTSPNSRRISGEIIMDVPVDDIWRILTDYDNLSSHVPNLVESRVINNGGRVPGGRPRVYQRGAQRIFGFEFGADVTMDMTERVRRGRGGRRDSDTYSVDFKCVDSQFFSQFDGSWILERYSLDKTLVRYVVDVRPKGPVPVAALEWRIREDVPVNILAVSESARSLGDERRRAESDVEAVEGGDVVDGPHVDVPTRLWQPNPEETSTHPLPQPQFNPLRQFTDRAAYSLKRTAKSVLPSPVYTTAKQAIRAMNGSNSAATAPPTTRTVAEPPAPFDDGGDGLGARTIIDAGYDGRREGNGLADGSFVEWYEDETMAMYLKESR